MPAAAHRPLTLVVAGDLDQPTGGYRYDGRIVDGLRRAGVEVHVRGLDGVFPGADQRAALAFDAALSDCRDGAAVVVDGLVMGNLPEVVERHADRLDLTALVHHPLGDETGLTGRCRARYHRREIAALRRVARIIVTSAFTARRLAELGLTGAALAVVEPGVDPAPLARHAWPAAPGDPLRLLCVASLTPRKGHRVLIQALSGLGHRRWRLDCIGAGDRDREEALALERLVADLGLRDRVALHGEVAETALDAAYRAADLAVVPSLYEGYGMVVTESLARGLPLVATRGGALADTVPVSAAWQVAPGDVDALREALEAWWREPAERERRREGAVCARASLGDWERAATAFGQALGVLPATPDQGQSSQETVTDTHHAKPPSTHHAKHPSTHHHGAEAGSSDVGAGVIATSCHFDPHWLALREGVDARSRAASLSELLTRALQHALTRKAVGAELSLVDLGAGAGSNTRYLAARLPRPQRWTLIDHDAALLAMAQSELSGTCGAVECRREDLAQWCQQPTLAEAALAGADLVSGAALIDLVSTAWLETLAAACSKTRSALLMTLNVDGDWGFVDSPTAQRAPLPAALERTENLVRALFAEHQRRDKGMGPALGGAAGGVLEDCLLARGYRVWRMPSPWLLDPSHDARLGERLIDGWRDAALDQLGVAQRGRRGTQEGQREGRQTDGIARWWRSRRDQWRRGEVSIFVGHDDVLALPEAWPAQGMAPGRESRRSRSDADAGPFLAPSLPAPSLPTAEPPPGGAASER
ncbi:glycosyltransferase [Halomonas sp. V046]|uniref:glycosyltransferase n=1 Tax=Halomonas sp. V046 TaxID=3459611 RepID=UPI004044BDA6